jgi:hypothetical protein
MEPQKIGDTETMNYAAERFMAQSLTHTHALDIQQQAPDRYITIDWQQRSECYVNM